MDFLDKRIKVICDNLNKLKIKQTLPIDYFKYKEGNYIHPQDVDNDKDTPWKDFDTQKDHWY